MSTPSPTSVFHIVLDGERTSFSLDSYLADLLAIRLKQTPRTTEAHQAIRTFVTEALFADSAFDPKLPISRQARRKALETIAKPSLIEKYWDWCLAHD